MCDRIKEDDERISILNTRNDKCISINKGLEKCLKENDRDFRKCKLQVQELKICMEEKLKSQLVSDKLNV